MTAEQISSLQQANTHIVKRLTFSGVQCLETEETKKYGAVIWSVETIESGPGLENPSSHCMVPHSSSNHSVFFGKENNGWDHLSSNSGKNIQ